MGDQEPRWLSVFVALDAENVRYRRVDGYDDYIITEDGRLFSGRKLRIKQLARRVNVKGYDCATLFNEQGGKHFPIHRLVALSFLGKPTPGSDHVNHKDGRKLNNHVSNLEWCSNLENIRHAWAAGLNKVTDAQRAIFKAASLGRRQLESHEAAAILQQYQGKRGEQRVLAAKYGVDYRVIWKLVNGMTYKDIREAA